MSYFMNNAMGESLDEPTEAEIREILTELQNTDTEHFDVSLIHESGWSLSVYPDRTLVWENVNDGGVEPLELALESWHGVTDALLKLSRGDISAVISLWHES
ncbi:hypothetical protein ACFY2T_05075 [Streptomyces sp. NPDC001260]|uniref:hypothetical protein n=1 Tax=Streptomyces sp. NPDC001260 TaxID=3364551 RepID=UPI0036BCFA34